MPRRLRARLNPRVTVVFPEDLWAADRYRRGMGDIVSLDKQKAD